MPRLNAGIQDSDFQKEVELSCGSVGVIEKACLLSGTVKNDKNIHELINNLHFINI